MILSASSVLPTLPAFCAFFPQMSGKPDGPCKVVQARLLERVQRTLPNADEGEECPFCKSKIAMHENPQATGPDRPADAGQGRGENGGNAVED